LEIATALTSLQGTIIQGICITIQALKQIRLIAILKVDANNNVGNGNDFAQKISS
jgi:hypothetical protein